MNLVLLTGQTVRLIISQLSCIVQQPMLLLCLSLPMCLLALAELLVLIDIPYSLNNSYYITIRHRNSIETTTAVPVSFAGSIINQSFGNPSFIFGSNLGVSFDGHYLIYGGDVNQDGTVDSGDYPSVVNDNFNYVSGYLATDIDGNGSIDSGDYPVMVNNNFNYIGTIHP